MPIISPSTKTDNYKIAFGTHTTVAASDTINTGLQRVVAVQATLASDPVAGAQAITAVAAATPGDITIKGWKATATADTAQVAATTFGKVVNWVAYGY